MRTRTALLADILDVLHGASVVTGDQRPPTPTEEFSPSELRVLRYLPTNLSRSEIASELSVSVSTVNIHVRNIYAKVLAIAEKWRPYRSLATSYLFSAAFEPADVASADGRTRGAAG